MVLVLGSIFGAILLLMNLVIVACCLRRRRSRLASAKQAPGTCTRYNKYSPLSALAGFRPPEYHRLADRTDLALVIIVAVVCTAGVLLVINALVIAYFFYKKRKRISGKAREAKEMKDMTGTSVRHHYVIVS